MKKLYALIVSSLALGFVGCAVDGVDNVVAPIGDNALEVNIAEPHTKVSLNDKVDGSYSAYWNEGDRISVNGNISDEAIISGSNPTSARFEFTNAILDYPYSVLYPASESNQVLFAAKQNYVEGTFESGTTPMFASVASQTESIKLNHLSGVLRFNIKGATNTTTLKKMVLKAAEGYIAGAFSLDFASGALTPTEAVSSTLEYSFGEGLALSTKEAKSFFVVLPCGEFGTCSAELHTTDGAVMYVRFKTSGTSAIKAGVVREFGEITFKNGASCSLVPFESEDDDLSVDIDTYTKQPTEVDGDFLVINEARELIWLCYNKPVVNGVNYNKIRIGANIDMDLFSTLPMPAMQLEEGAEIDGNHKTITGLNMDESASSIFGDIDNANIHDLTLTNCSVNTELQTGAGILVGKASAGLTVSNVTFNDCSVMAPRKIGLVAGALHTGTFSISDVKANGGFVETTFVAGKSGLAGGLVGCFAKDGDGATTSTATFTNCTVSTTVISYMEYANYFYGKIVGQLGGYNGDEKLYFVNCDGVAAKLIALYDQGEKIAETARLSFCEEHRADFCTKTLTAATDNILGGERYCRGEVYFDGERFVSDWDGKRAATMLTETVDGITRYLVYSPYDLAKAQAQKYSATKALVFMTDVDMGGQIFKPIEYVINLDGQNHSLYNLKVDVVHNAASNYGAGFIVYANNAATHKDLTFVGADVNCRHDASIAMPAYGVTDDNGAGNAYAGILVSRSWRTAIKDDAGNTTGYTNYNVSNVHVRDSKVRGVCKVGGLIGACRGQVYIDNCSVDNSVVENYDPQVVNYYTMKKSVMSGSYMVEGLQWWYTAGECGGLIGFLEAHYAEITNCAVTNTQINCTGQPNKDVVANIWDTSEWVEGAYTSGKKIRGNATTTIAGRHINQFIGDVRSRRSESQQENNTGEYTNKILNYTLSGNTYNGVAANSTNDYNHNYASGKYCDAVGCAYYTGVDIGSIAHVSECAGTLIFQPKGGESVTLTEAIGSGDHMDWFGGNCKDLKYIMIAKVGTSYYPEAPAQ